MQVANGDTPVNYKGSTGFDVNSGVQFNWKSLLTLGYSLDRMDVSLRWRFLPSVENVAVVLTPTAQVNDTASNSELDLTGTWHMTDGVTVRLGIQNLANTESAAGGRHGHQFAGGLNRSERCIR